MKSTFLFNIFLYFFSYSPSRNVNESDLKPRERYLIITADDYGASQNINEGIRIAAENNIITTISAMTNFRESIGSLKSISESFPSIGIGVHLNITAGKPLSHPKSIPTLVDEQGNFYSISNLLPRLKSISLEELEAELRAQLLILSDNGIKVDHLSDQHGILSLYPSFFRLVIGLAREYSLPLRSNEIASMKYPGIFPHSEMQKEGHKILRSFVISNPLKALTYLPEFSIRNLGSGNYLLDSKQIVHPNLLIDYFYGNPTESNLAYILENLPAGINELVLHLGTSARQEEYPTGLNLEYFSNRELELTTVNNTQFNDQLIKRNIQKVNYYEIQRILNLHSATILL